MGQQNMAGKRASVAQVSLKNSANIGFEAKLWLTADKLRNNMDASEYKHVVLGLISLKYISDSFEAHRAELLAGVGAYAEGQPREADEFRAENVSSLPQAARYSPIFRFPLSSKN